MKKIIFFLTVVVFFVGFNACCLYSKDLNSYYGGYNFQPLTAYIFEPRNGFVYQFDTEKLRLDIGKSLDLFNFKLGNSKNNSFGADFFTYTRLRTAGNFKFPVETTDFYFGINSSFCNLIQNVPLAVRVRVAHISSHLVDGYAKDSIFNKTPYVYSREFVDIAATYSFCDYSRIYLGSKIIFHTIPDCFSVFNPQIGFDFYYPLNNSLSLRGGYDFRMVGIDEKMFGNNSAQLSLFVQTGENTGINFGYYGYSGKSIHGLFYNDYDSYNAFGFELSF